MDVDGRRRWMLNAETDFADMIAASPAIGFLPKIHLSGSAIRALLTNADTAH